MASNSIKLFKAHEKKLINLLITAISAIILLDIIKYLPDEYLPNPIKKIPLLSEQQLSNIHETFDIYVINLEYDHARLQRFTQRMGDNKLSFTRFKGIDGRTLNRNNMIKNKIITKSFDQIATPGEVGCAMSHVTLWDLAQQSKKPYIIVFEDDIMIQKNLGWRLHQLSHYIKQYQFDLLLLGRDQGTQKACQLGKLKPHMCHFYHNNVFPREEPSRFETRKIITPPYSGGTFAYIINTKSIPRLIKTHHPINNIADREYWNPEHQLDIKAVHPIWFTWHDHESAYGDSRTEESRRQSSFVSSKIS